MKVSKSKGSTVLSGLKCDGAEDGDGKIPNHVDKYVITKHYYQLMPLSLATVNKSPKRQGSYGVKKQRYTGTARKRIYVHANRGCIRYKLHGMT
ncbi:hypothetical protein T06_9130 [Trichinella sp. T6]|nr:hypothetical protein T06_9130 [Trichinella sp. T6]